jgi:ferredoxin-NADP reductase
MALQPFQKGRVIRIVDETPSTKRYWIEAYEKPSFDFQAGQFITLDLPIHEKPNKRLRSYSIASWPDGGNLIELVIVLNPAGAGTPWLFENYKVGTEVLFRGPQGVFTLPETVDKDLYMICTGTGIAPFRSMVHTIKLKNIPHKKIYIIFGCRKKEDLLYFPELDAFQKELNDFHYIPTLSREQWEGKSGYVHPIYLDLIKDKPEAYFFVCGWKNMIDEAKKNILELGYDKKAIHQELYG